jgi:uncharacterized protein
LKPTIVPHSSELKNSKGSRPFGLTPLARVALAAVRGYQVFIRPALNGSCRYLPTCSEYAAQSIATYGVCRGGWMGLKRVLRCHPLGSSGLDPVP